MCLDMAPSAEKYRRDIFKSSNTGGMETTARLLHVRNGINPFHWCDDGWMTSLVFFLLLSPGVQFSQESLDLSERGIPGNTVLGGGAYQLFHLQYVPSFCVVCAIMVYVFIELVLTVFSV